ncbi:MAG: replication protein DnaC, partial [Thermoleophilaceae bacterium]|nr:replication protein DnaC [Thermoleophilaceae bacterium]
DWVLEQLYTIVNTRYEDGRAIMLTTNILDSKKLEAQIGTRTVSRLHEICGSPLPFLSEEDARIGAGDRLPEPAPQVSVSRPGRWLSEQDRTWEAADPDEPPAYGRPRAQRLD